MDITNIRPRGLGAAVLVTASLLAAAVTHAAAPAGGQPAQASAATPAQGEGEKVYARWCRHCHDGGRGMPGTQSLQIKYGGKIPAVLLERTDLTAEAVAGFVRQGVLSMPPFRKTEISDAELAALAAYVARKRQKSGLAGRFDAQDGPLGFVRGHTRCRAR